MSNLAKNRQDIIDTIVADDTTITKAQAKNALASFEKAITQALKEGGTATLVGFGTFSVTDRKARTGRNPQTGEAIQISAKKTPAFKAGKALKEAVN